MTRKTTLTLIVGTSLLLGGTTVAAQNGAALAEKCERCHGTNGNSDKEKVPSIAGLSAFYFVDTMNHFKHGKRPSQKFQTYGYDKTDMNAIAERLTTDELNALGDYFADQTFLPSPQNVDEALADKGKKLYNRRCGRCHEDNGSNPDDDAGLLAGQWMPYLKSQLEQFVSGERKPPKKMKKQLNKLEDGDIPALLHFFASQQ